MDRVTESMIQARKRIQNPAYSTPVAGGGGAGVWGGALSVPCRRAPQAAQKRASPRLSCPQLVQKMALPLQPAPSRVRIDCTRLRAKSQSRVAYTPPESPWHEDGRGVLAGQSHLTDNLCGQAPWTSFRTERSEARNLKRYVRKATPAILCAYPDQQRRVALRQCRAIAFSRERL